MHHPRPYALYAIRDREIAYIRDSKRWIHGIATLHCNKYSNRTMTYALTLPMHKLALSQCAYPISREERIEGGRSNQGRKEMDRSYKGIYA